MPPGIGYPDQSMPQDPLEILMQQLMGQARMGGPGAAPGSPGAGLPVAAPTVQPGGQTAIPGIDEIERLLSVVEPEKLSTGRRVGLAAVDALNALLAMRQGRESPGPAYTMQALEGARGKAQSQTAANLARARVLEGRRQEGREDLREGREIERGMEERRYQEGLRTEQRDFEQRVREDDRSLRREDADKDYRRGLLASAADAGAILEGDPESMPESKILSAIATARRRAEVERLGDRGADKAEERRVTARSDGEALLTSYMLGNPTLNPPLAKVEERLAAGQKPADIMFEFRRQLAPLGLDKEEELRLRSEFMKYVWDKAQGMGMGDRTARTPRDPTNPMGFTGSPLGIPAGPDNSFMSTLSEMLGRR